MNTGVTRVIPEDNDERSRRRRGPPDGYAGKQGEQIPHGSDQTTGRTYPRRLAGDDAHPGLDPERSADQTRRVGKHSLPPHGKSVQRIFYV
jgi:hypothetical protein